MQTFSDINFIKQLQMQQKIRFNNEVRSEKLAALLISKRNFFLGKKESININAIISNMKLFIDDINIEEILKNLQLINDYVLDSSKEDLTYIYKNLCKNINELIDLLKNNDENYPLLSEISMFFINFSALLDDASDLNNFIEKIGEEFIEFLKQTEFLNLKNNLLIVFGNLCLKSFDATKILVNKFGFLQAILEILIEHNNDLNEKFLELIIWVLDILLESTQSPQYFVKT